MMTETPAGEYAPRLVGHGPHRVLAFNGWFGSSEAWGHFPDYIDHNRFTYAFFDYRGYGRRKGVAGAYTIAEIAADALNTADQLGWERFDVMGHSMGGLVIQQVLADAPDRVGRLVAISGVPATGAQFDDETFARFAAAPGDDGVRAALTAHSSGDRLTASFYDRIVRESRAGSTEEAYAGHLRAWVRTDISGLVKGHEHPVLVIAGEHDPALNEAAMRATWLALFPNAHLAMIPGAGHYAMHETPVMLATVVENFLLSRGGGNGAAR